jgi:inner membrane protein
LTHAVVALSLGSAWRLSRSDWKFLAWGVVCAEIPDADVLGFWLGLHYGDLWGHRGMTHSLFFAAVLATVLAYATGNRIEGGGSRVSHGVYFFLATASHGVADAMTDGGLGVAFFAPFDPTRYFASFRPVVVSPLGVEEFFSPIGARVLISEAKWIWLPCLMFVIGVALAHRVFAVQARRP